MTQTELDDLIKARHAFVVRYCTQMGWPTEAERLTIAQVLQIRAQDGWKNPVGAKRERAE